MSKAAELAALIGSQSALENRNFIINGAMQVAQRGTSVSSFNSEGYASLDRWKLIGSNFGTWTVSQSTDVPSGQGFGSSMKLDCTSADTSIGASDSLRLRQGIEGQNVQNLAKGTSGAKSVTFSFWVKSNKTGTYGFEFRDQDNTRHNCRTYTIDSANTWEKKTLSFPGDTSGALDNDNAMSLQPQWFLIAGSNLTSGSAQTTWGSAVAANRAVGHNVNIADSTDNEWYICGVQMELGDVATPFEHRSFGDELRRCQRYFELIGYSIGRAVSATQVEVNSAFKVDKRAAPTIALNDTTTAVAEFLRSGSNINSLDSTYVTLTTHCGNRLTSSDTGMNSGSLAGIIKEDALSADAEL
tara:strand:- start:530 stop:1597 length:1068 start_codon:yes stop_codon:yes gene_type:complete